MSKNFYFIFTYEFKLCERIVCIYKIIQINYNVLFVIKLMNYSLIGLKTKINSLIILEIMIVV